MDSLYKTKRIILIITAALGFLWCGLFLLVPNAYGETVDEEVLIPSTPLVNYETKHNVQKVVREGVRLEKAYKGLVDFDYIGTTVKGTKIPLIKIGKGNKKGLLVGAIHGREHITTSYLMRCIDEYAINYAKGKSYSSSSYNIRSLLDEYTLYIVPMMNPDGVSIVYGQMNPAKTIPNLSKYRNEFKANANGVDLNRNFPYRWDKLVTSVNKRSHQFYKGPYANSERETKAIVNLCEKENFKFMLSFHIRGNIVYYPEETNPKIKSLAYKLGKLANMKPVKMSKNTPVDGGGLEKWFGSKYNRPSYCIEFMTMSQNPHYTNSTNHKNFSKILKWSLTKKIPLEMMESL